MNIRTLFLIVALSPLAAFAQNDTTDSTAHAFWASFTDKKDSPYSVDKPIAYLSERAIERRQRLGIAITEQDFPPNPAYLEGLREQGATVLHYSRWLNAATFNATSSTAEQIAALPFVDTVWLAGPYRIPFEARAHNFNMDSLTVKARPDESYGYGKKQIALLNGDSLHQLGFRGEGMLIGVLDGGFIGADRSPFFDSLRADGRLLPSVDIIDGDTLAWESSTHGTKVLSTMGANIEGVLVGTAPEASYVCIKTEETRGEHRVEECHWVAGIEYADSMGVDVVNSSLGYTTFEDPSMNYDSTSLNGKLSVASLAADIASEKGILVVTSAGNEGGSPWRYIGIPADAANALSIGATDLNGNLASFSSVGPVVPGRIKPDVIAPGAWVFTADAYRYRTSFASGTSFASPITAGLVACLRQAFPNKSVKEICDAVRLSGSKAAQPDYEQGYGLPDFVKAYRLLRGEVKP
jgi:subtilisin family serine protease